MADANASPTLQATSALRKSGMSITLPRNFAPLSLDGSAQEPRTPDQTFAELSLPPPPPHSTFRVRRPRINMGNFQARNNALPATLFASEIPSVSSSPIRLRPDVTLPLATLSSDVPMQSIENTADTTTFGRPLLARGASEPLSAVSLQVSHGVEQTPTTPIAQTKLMMPEIKHGSWDMQRAASVCSVRSDSSISSDESFATRPTSFDGSATSPDCDNQDPFSPQMVNIIPDTPTRRCKKMRINTSFSKDNIEWSIEMDNHLFNVYQIYLADPTVTPFKTVPGSIPPTGVCHRVARRARETWPKASRIAVPIIKRYRMRNLLDIRRNLKERTPEPDDFLKVDDAAGLGDANSNSWPSESSTRRRLKQLCREKFTITAHYQRLRASRSPSPFSDQFTRRPTSRLNRTPSNQTKDVDQAGTYTTRELGISLVANDATAPLAQLMSEDNSASSAAKEEWFNNPVQKPSTMNLKTPVASSIDLDRLAPTAANIPRLASPFNYSTWNGLSNRQPFRRQISHGQYDTIHATGTRLLSPFQLGGHNTINNNKRRAQHNLDEELSPSGSNLGVHTNAMCIDGTADPEIALAPSCGESELVFSGNGDIGQRRIRLRNRGATLGAATNAGRQDRIESLFTPPTFHTTEAFTTMPQLSPFVTQQPLQSSQHPSSAFPTNLAIPQADPIHRRLGSPFELDPSKRSLRNKNPRHVPSLSDPFISTDHFGLHSSDNAANPNANLNSIGNIGERLALFSNLYQQHQTPN